MKRRSRPAVTGVDHITDANRFARSRRLGVTRVRAEAP